MKRLSAFLVFALTLIALTGSAFAWPGSLEGRPDELRDNERGYFIWHDKQGLHLRTNNKGHQERVYTGVIRTDGKFVDVDDFRNERNDHIRVSRDRDTIWFRFSTAGGLDGLDFRIRGGDHVSFDLYVDGRQINKNQIYLGEQGRHPRDNNFTIRR